jgi:hypothetical protein
MGDRTIQGLDEAVPVDPAVASARAVELRLDELVDRRCGCHEVAVERPLPAGRHRRRLIHAVRVA